MEPDQQSSNWQNNQNPDEITETYTPEPAGDDLGPVVESADDSQSDMTEQTQVADEEPVHWTASEYIHQDKNGLWYTIFGIVVLAFITVDLLVFKSYTFSVLVLVMAVAIIIYSRRPPRTVEYTLSGNQGLFVGEKLYHFSEFKAFGLINDMGQHSIMMVPIKRFSTGISVYFPEDVGEKIVDILGARLPMKDLKLDAVDILVRKLRL